MEQAKFIANDPDDLEPFLSLWQSRRPPIEADAAGVLINDQTLAATDSKSVFVAQGKTEIERQIIAKAAELEPWPKEPRYQPFVRAAKLESRLRLIDYLQGAGAISYNQLVRTILRDRYGIDPTTDRRSDEE